ncbi:MAG: hypothetical protein U5M23_00660 [Marinagarivorans sp.]|nr:hypothetical protein [Marinagarivorans sp.]
MGKFTVLFLATLGYYSIYWFYKNWSQIGKYQDRNTYPILRAAFSIFFVPQLSKELTTYQQQSQRTYHWKPAVFVLGYIGLVMLSLPLSFALVNKSISLGWVWLQMPVLVIQYYLTYQFQLVANHACADPFGKENEKFTPANHAWIIVGMVLWFDQLKLLYLVSTGQYDQIGL